MPQGLVGAQTSEYEIMEHNLKPIREWHEVNEEIFQNEIISRYEPAVLRNVVSSWPAVQKGKQSAEALAKYFCDMDSGSLVHAVLVRPGQNGRVFYNEEMNGFNFLRDNRTLSEVILQAAKYSHFENPPAVALQCAKIKECAPNFLAENVFPFLSQDISPRLWLGGAAIVAAHFDEMDNIACVVGGRRKFVLFPPEQIANLYIGPVDFTPAGAPVSMVDFNNPDFEAFPRYREALAAAQSAILEPGDAIYIPSVWWHHVESLDVLNVLVNYWWSRGGDAVEMSPVQSLMRCILNLGGLPPSHRKGWGSVFSHFVFDADENSVAHVPAQVRGILGELTLEQRLQIARKLEK